MSSLLCFKQAAEFQREKHLKKLVQVFLSRHDQQINWKPHFSWFTNVINNWLTHLAQFITFMKVKNQTSVIMNSPHMFSTSSDYLSLVEPESVNYKNQFGDASIQKYEPIGSLINFVLMVYSTSRNTLQMLQLKLTAFISFICLDIIHWKRGSKVPHTCRLIHPWTKHTNSQHFLWPGIINDGCRSHFTIKCPSFQAKLFKPFTR